MKEKMNTEDIAKALGAKFIGFSPAPPMFVPVSSVEGENDEKSEECESAQLERPPEYWRKKRRDLLRSLVNQYVENAGLAELQEHIRRSYGVSIVFYDIHGLRFRGERSKNWELGSEATSCDIASISGHSSSPEFDSFRIDFLDFLGKKDATRKLFSAFRRKVEEFRV